MKYLHMVLITEAQFMATNINESLQGVKFEFETPFGSYHVESPYVGKFNISNIMAAIIAVWSKGISFEEIIKAVKSLEPVEGRLEVLDPSLPIDLIIDYAHTADGMNKLIDAVKPFVKQKLIFLVGMAGERDMTKLLKWVVSLVVQIMLFLRLTIPLMMIRKCLQLS